MHIILGLLGTIVTILVLLNRLGEAGIDLGWLNPFTWHRRRKYRLNHDLNPAFKLTSPLDTAALVLVTIAKAEGDMSREQKAALLKMFEQKFHLSERQAIDLLGASVHLFGRGDEVLAKPQHILDRSLEHFSPDQLESLTGMMDEVARLDGEPGENQRKVVKKIQSVLPKATQPQWQ